MWTVFNFLKRFFLDLYRATIFAGLEYDDQLRMTKTPKQRALIWTVIGCVAVSFFYMLIQGAWYFVNSLEAYKIVPGE